ncbi:DUF1287 domain-containing protein [Desulfovibrio sp. OttesenSCG-928-O18]|nr:DUF1287 domain-containing protein [Desulfovibrio sp. OttesenSCG-928-O18]
MPLIVGRLALFLAAFVWIASGVAQAAMAGAKSAPAPHVAFAAKLVEGAREEAQRAPLYRSAYYSGGYPPAAEGVCTDLVWRAFRHAGYDLKKMIDADIRQNRAAYPRARAKPDPNIDFRRVPNQTAFFRRHAKSLTTRVTPAAALAEWQAGDIVVFANPDHIAILSDKRNAEGIPLLLHNQGPFASEGDDFMAWYARGIVAHFRFPAPHVASR